MDYNTKITIALFGILIFRSPVLGVSRLQITHYRLVHQPPCIPPTRAECRTPGGQRQSCGVTRVCLYDPLGREGKGREDGRLSLAAATDSMPYPTRRRVTRRAAAICCMGYFIL